MSKFNFKELIKKSWQLAKSARLLWIFGIFIGGTFYYDFRGWDGAGFSLQSALENLLKAVQSGGIVSFLVFTGLILLVAIFFGLLARGAIIVGVKNARDGVSNSFKELFAAGLKKIWPLFALEVILGLPNLVLTGAITWSLFAGAASAVKAAYYSFAALFVVYNIFVLLFKHYAYCYIVLENESPWKAIKASFNLLKLNFIAFLVARLIEIGLLAAAILAVVLALFVGALPFLLIGVIVLIFVSNLAAGIVAGVGIFTLIILLAILRGMVNTFIQSYLTFVYWRAREN